MGEHTGAIGRVLVDEDKVKPEWVYNHAICTVALCEAYRATQDPSLEDPCKRAVDVCLRAQNPHFGWRYGMRSGDNDSSVTSWMVQALWTAKKAGFSVPDEALRGAEEWFDRVTSIKGIAGYRHPVDEWDPRQTPAMPAAGMLSRFLLGTRKFDLTIRGPARLLMEHLPRWTEERGRIDLYYWYHGTYAMRRVGGKQWKEWRKATEDALLPEQRTGEDIGGSWDPVGKWGTTGGRVYSTAMAVLILEGLGSGSLFPPS